MVYKLFPSICPICERHCEAGDLTICRYCLECLPKIHHACFSCGLPLEEGSGFSGNDVTLRLSCGACLSNSPPQYRGVSAFSYEFPIPEMLGEIKFHNKPFLAKGLAEQFVQTIHYQYQDDSLPQCIIPVPLHPRREFKRGFNQSLLFSKKVGKFLEIKTDGLSIRRIRHTQSQMQLDIKQRQKNMKNVFASTKKIEWKHVAVFDDVMTTGATMHSMTQVLLKAGVKRVDLWSLARTPKN